jgi:hypothetical protein
LEGSDILQTFAEISIAFAGFTSVVAVLGRRAAGDWREVDLFRLWQMLINSLGCVLLSLLPLVLHKLRVSEGLSWAIASASLGVFLIVRGSSAVRRVRLLATEEQTEMSSLYFNGLGFLGILILALLFLNAVGVAFQRDVGPYLLGILYLVGICAFQFTRLLLVLRPSGPNAD